MTTQGCAQGVPSCLTRMDDKSTSPSRQRRHTGLAGQLNAQWDSELADSSLPDSWSGHDALTGAATLQEVIDLCLPTQPSATHDQVLYALICLTQDGCQTASRCLVQTMLSKLVRLSKTAAARGVEDPIPCVLTTFLEQVHRYRRHLRSRVAGNLALNTLSALPVAATEEELVGIDPVTELGASHRWCSINDAVNEAEHNAHLITAALTWALDRKILTRADIALLTRRYLSGRPQAPTLAQIAEETGQSYEYLRKRHAGAVRRLTQAAAHRAA